MQKWADKCIKVTFANKYLENICIVSGPRVIQLLLLDPTQVESKKSSQIQWPVPSINAEPVDIFLGEE